MNRDEAILRVFTTIMHCRQEHEKHLDAVTAAEQARICADNLFGKEAEEPESRRAE